MKFSDRLPGKTLAESLGLQIPETAPGGSVSPALSQDGGQRSTRKHKLGTEIEYEGFSDLDGYR